MNTIKFTSGKDMKEIKEGNDVSIVEDTKSILDKISELI